MTTLQIKGDGSKSSVKVNGIEMGDFASSFRLVHEAGCLPELVITIPVSDELEIEIPEGVIVIEKLVKE